jgi:hypothetical protein
VSNKSLLAGNLTQDADLLARRYNQSGTFSELTIKIERRLKEERLRNLLAAGLAGDPAAYRLFLSELTAHLRAFLRRRLARLPEEVEDLVQELLVAIHNQRHTHRASPSRLAGWVGRRFRTS